MTQTNTMLFKTLDAALSLRRPHGSAQVAELLLWLMANLPEDLECRIDAAGNMHVDARTDVNHRTLFIAHVDTVHRTGGDNKINKTDTKWSAGMKDQCLGADDGAGVAMLMHLMHSGIPGYYIFSQGEECGGIGAKFLADFDDATLLQFDRAIAFDRKGIDSVITHQFGGRCCSDAFALALSLALNTASDDALFLAPDNTGVYTDTAEFTGLISECTNISIGYDGAHGDKESIDVVYLQMLADAVVQINWDNLPTERDPSAVDADDWGWNTGAQWGNYDWGAMPDVTGVKEVKGKFIPEYTLEIELQEALDDAMYGRHNTLINLIAEHTYPEDPVIAKRQINKNRLTDDVLAWAEEMLYDGQPARDILDALFEGTQTH